MMNPFDDSYQDRNPFVAGNSNLSQSLNPFDSDGVTAAPAVDHYFGTTNTAATVDDDEEDADLDSHEQEPIDSFVSVEASWQYLGDLPYRRIPIYSSVLWETNDKTKIVDDHSSNNNNNNRYANALQNQQHQYGLASFPSSLFLQSSKSHNFSNPRIMLSKTTVTKCVGCPNGGPIAVVTLPLTGHMTTSSTSGLASQHMQQQHHSTTNDATYTAGTVPIRILTVSGKLLSCIDFPPSPTANKIPNNNRQYAPADIFSIGFTNRCILIVITKDSYCFTFNLKGESVLPPFCILENTTSASGGTDLQLAHIYEGGVAVLGTNKDSALVELLDKYDSDLEYLSTVHHSARRVVPHQSTKNMMNMGNTADNQSWITNQETDELPSNFAIVTSFPTAVYATSNACHYCAIGVLPRTRTVSRHPEIFLSTSDHSVIVVNAMTTRCTDVNCRSRISSPIVDMCFAPNGRFLACFTESSMLTVISTSFETKVLDFDTSEGSNTPPLEMKWCGEDSVVLHWKNLGILMVGPYGDWLRFPYQGMENVFLLPEIDCCRVITDTTVEILQRVPPTTALLLRIGSIDAAAMLLDASDSYYAGSPSSSDTTNAITETGMLEEAIEACTDAAMKEFDIRTQKRLLRAASYGMHFSYKAIEGKSLIGGPVTGPSTDNRTSGIVGEYRMLPSKTATKFVDAARSIRILNALRHPNIGFVVTAAQFDSMTPTGVIARLIAMKRPSLASAISNYLHLPKSVQLYARACGAAALIESAPMQWSDSEIAERAIRMINGNGSSGPPLKDSSASHNMNRGGYATVAMTANAVGRPGVANLLLMLETSVADKVPALISTGSYADALAVATAARDADFIFSSLMEYERACLLSATNANDVSRAQATFLSTVVSKFTTEAFHTLRRYLQSINDVKNLLSLLLKAQRFSDAGIAIGKKSLQTEDFREKQSMLSESSRIFGLGKETAFHKTTTDEYIELLKDQETLRAKYGSFDVAPGTSSVTVSISAILSYAATTQDQREKMQLLADAEKLARKARISPKRLYHIRVKAYADGGHWTTLTELAESRQTPLGYKPFVRAAIYGYQGNNRDEYILSFIQKLGSNEERFDMLCEAALWKQALKVAEKDLKDIRRVKQMKDRCTDKTLHLEVEEALGRLAT